MGGGGGLNVVGVFRPVIRQAGVLSASGSIRKAGGGVRFRPNMQSREGGGGGVVHFRHNTKARGGA